MSSEARGSSSRGPNSGPGEAIEPGDLESARKGLEEEKARAEKYLANWQRAEADFVNYKRRNEQERAEAANFANCGLVSELLPVLDDFERALKNASGEVAESPWVDGVRLIYRKLKGVLEAQGLCAVEAEGKDFDPSCHDAAMCMAGEEGKVLEEVQRGYRFRNRLLRPAKVIVGKAEQSGQSSEKTE